MRARLPRSSPELHFCFDDTPVLAVRDACDPSGCRCARAATRAPRATASAGTRRRRPTRTRRSSLSRAPAVPQRRPPLSESASHPQPVPRLRGRLRPPPPQIYPVLPRSPVGRGRRRRFRHRRPFHSSEEETAVLSDEGPPTWNATRTKSPRPSSRRRRPSAPRSHASAILDDILAPLTREYPLRLVASPILVSSSLEKGN